LDNTSPTHILVTHKSQRACLLFRADTGILVCMQQREVCVYGDNPKDKNSYTFIDDKRAADWLRAYAVLDLKKQGREEVTPMFDERDAEAHGLYVPDDSLELPGFGPHMRPVGSKSN
jgi:hypothetical protein